MQNVLEADPRGSNKLQVSSKSVLITAFLTAFFAAVKARHNIPAATASRQSATSLSYPT